MVNFRDYVAMGLFGLSALVRPVFGQSQRLASDNIVFTGQVSNASNKGLDNVVLEYHMNDNGRKVVRKDLSLFDGSFSTVYTDVKDPVKTTSSSALSVSLGRSHDVKYFLTKGGVVNLAIFDILGREVSVNHLGNQSVGVHDLVWDGKNMSGTPVAVGIYFAVLKSSDGNIVLKFPHSNNDLSNKLYVSTGFKENSQQNASKFNTSLGKVNAGVSLDTLFLHKVGLETLIIPYNMSVSGNVNLGHFVGKELPIAHIKGMVYRLVPDSWLNKQANAVTRAVVQIGDGVDTSDAGGNYDLLFTDNNVLQDVLISCLDNSFWSRQTLINPHGRFVSVGNTGTLWKDYNVKPKNVFTPVFEAYMDSTFIHPWEPVRNMYSWNVDPDSMDATSPTVYVSIPDARRTNLITDWLKNVLFTNDTYRSPIFSTQGKFSKTKYVTGNNPPQTFTPEIEGIIVMKQDTTIPAGGGVYAHVQDGKIPWGDIELNYYPVWTDSIYLMIVGHEIESISPKVIDRQYDVNIPMIIELGPRNTFVRPTYFDDIKNMYFSSRTTPLNFDDPNMRDKEINEDMERTVPRDAVGKLASPKVYNMSGKAYGSFTTTNTVPLRFSDYDPNTVPKTREELDILLKSNIDPLKKRDNAYQAMHNLFMIKD